MKTLKYLVVTTAAIIGLMALANSASALVEGGPHDLTVATGSGGLTETADGGNRICVFCHSPHTEISATVPLWNRGASTATFSMYSRSTIDMDIGTQPEGISMACLSCHDGVTALDQLINAPTTVSRTYNYIATGANQTYVWTATDLMTGTVTAIGTDLRGDHPISVAYDPARDSAFNSAVSVEAAGLPLFAGTSGVDRSGEDPVLSDSSGLAQVECATCHDPHSTIVPFLRIANTASDICTTCHIK